MPGARQDLVVGPHAGVLKMTVTAPPEKGRANKAVERLVATVLNVATSRVKVVSGATSRDKVILVSHCAAAEVRRQLEGVPRISTAPAKG
jgi:uncharacterized protein YggU (UPF0235/DUF167 family)